MEGIPIKFRAEDAKTGELVTFGLGSCLEEADNFYTVLAEDVHPIYSNTIVQLVGYDAEGNEVYEGDRLIRKKSCDCIIAGRLFVELKNFVKSNGFVVERIYQ